MNEQTKHIQHQQTTRSYWRESVAQIFPFSHLSLSLSLHVLHQQILARVSSQRERCHGNSQACTVSFSAATGDDCLTFSTYI